MSAQHSNQGGFTLVEISMAMAIFTFMLLVVSLAYINIARLYNAATVARNVQQNNRFAMEQISRVARVSQKAAAANNGVCFSSGKGETLFYLKHLDGPSAANNVLVQSSDCGQPLDSNSVTLSSPNTYASRLEVDTLVGNTVTITLWMASKTDLLNTATNPTCASGAGSEFCAINKLTTTLEMRGE